MRRFPERLRTLFSTRDFLPKMACLALAIVLWAYISESKVGELTFRVPVVYRNLPPNTVVSFIADKTVPVIMQGRKEYLKSFQVKNVKAVVDFRSAKPGVSRRYPIILVKNDIPENISVELSRNHTEAMVEPAVSVNVRVAPLITGAVNPDYFAGRIQVKPDSVVVEGPQSVARGLKHINTEEIQLSDATRDVSVDVELKLDGNIKIPDLKNNSVHILIPVVKKNSLLSAISPVNVRNPQKGYLYQVNDHEIRIYYRSNERKIVTAGDIEAFVDAAAFAPDAIAQVKRGKTVTVKAPVRVALRRYSDAMEIVSSAPEEVSVTISRKQ